MRFGLLVLLLASHGCTLLFADEPEGRCEAEEFTADKRRYQFIDCIGGAGLTMTEAGADCQSRGGRLVVIESPLEQDLLVDNVPTRNNDFWIGLRFRTTGGWSWAGTSQPVSFYCVGTTCEMTLPTLFTGTCFVMDMDPDEGEPGAWIPKECEDPEDYLCELFPQDGGP